MTGGYGTEITGIVLDECQWSENTSDHGLVMKLSLIKNLKFPCYQEEEGLCLDSKLTGDVRGSSHVVQLSYHRTNPGPYTTQPFLMIHYCVNWKNPAYWKPVKSKCFS